MDYIEIGVIGAGVLAVGATAWWTIRTYNELTWHQIKVDKIAANLDAVLKYKFDLIPGLVEIVKGYAKHEQGILTEVTRLRSQWGKAPSGDDRVKTASMLEGALSKLLVVIERYPNLKANRNFLSIQRSMGHAENKVLHERMYYNEVVRRYNVRLKLFPRVIIAKLFGFKERAYFSLEEE
jgi:LemA protein